MSLSIPLLGVTFDAQAVIDPVDSVKWIVSLSEMVSCGLHTTLAVFFI
jgi:hypothetical protein